MVLSAPGLLQQRRTTNQNNHKIEEEITNDNAIPVIDAQAQGYCGHCGNRYRLTNVDLSDVMGYSSKCAPAHLDHRHSSERITFHK
ncbi:hypothetical protein GJ496_006500 [Pomphorhynchus laevis]|nr:hypothetical protein GJ496_006500 [Pomphorhynchus laevis]